MGVFKNYDSKSAAEHLFVCFLATPEQLQYSLSETVHGKL